MTLHVIGCDFIEVVGSLLIYYFVCPTSFNPSFFHNCEINDQCKKYHVVGKFQTVIVSLKFCVVFQQSQLLITAEGIKILTIYYVCIKKPFINKKIEIYRKANHWLI